MCSKMYLIRVKIDIRNTSDDQLNLVVLFLGDRQGLHVLQQFQISMRALGGIIW